MRQNTSPIFFPVIFVESQGPLRQFPLSQFHQFFSKCFSWCSPSQALSGCAVLPDWARKERPMASMLPYVMFDELNLPVDMIVTHSFTPINNNIMASRIKRQQRLMKASEDGAISLAEELVDALDNLESKRLSFGDHHMTVTIYAETEEKLEAIAAELRNITASEGVNLVNESFAAWTHYFAQHPGNGQMRSRKAAITNTNFADLAALHRGQLGKPGDRVPWGKPITLFPTPERSGFLFNYHEAGQPDKEPTGGHTLILGRPGSGKSVLSAFLMTQARRCEARVFVFDYRAGMEMAVRANAGRYCAIKAKKLFLREGCCRSVAVRQCAFILPMNRGPQHE